MSYSQVNAKEKAETEVKSDFCSIDLHVKKTFEK